MEESQSGTSSPLRFSLESRGCADLCVGAKIQLPQGQYTKTRRNIVTNSIEDSGKYFTFLKSKKKKES